MSQETSGIKSSNDNFRSISPTQELRFLDAMMADHELPTTARVLGYRLVRWTHGDGAHRFGGYSWASREKLAEKIGRNSETTITTGTNALRSRGWIIVKRRPNKTSLIRPNWDKINHVATDAAAYRQVMPVNKQKTVSPELQESGLPEVQKAGPYSADLDRADKDSVSFPNASRRECLTLSSEGAAQTGIDNDERIVGYKQTAEEAEQILYDLRRSWPEASEEAEYRPGADSNKAAAIHYYKLLKSGIAASHIRRAARHFLSSVPDRQWPCSLASFLTRYLEDYLDPDQPKLYIPPDEERPVPVNDNRRAPKRRASSTDWENDPPF